MIQFVIQKRRRFTILGLSLMLITAIQSCRKVNAISGDGSYLNKEVVIIGAGVSGLSAAKFLKDKGIEAIVLEARSEIGGRLKTDRSLGIAFDEGAKSN